MEPVVKREARKVKILKNSEDRLQRILQARNELENHGEVDDKTVKSNLKKSNRQKNISGFNGQKDAKVDNVLEQCDKISELNLKKSGELEKNDAAIRDGAKQISCTKAVVPDEVSVETANPRKNPDASPSRGAILRNRIFHNTRTMRGRRANARHRRTSMLNITDDARNDELADISDGDGDDGDGDDGDDDVNSLANFFISFFAYKYIYIILAIAVRVLLIFEVPVIKNSIIIPFMGIGTFHVIWEYVIIRNFNMREPVYLVDIMKILGVPPVTTKILLGLYNLLANMFQYFSLYIFTFVMTHLIIDYFFP